MVFDLYSNVHDLIFILIVFITIIDIKAAQET